MDKLGRQMGNRPSLADVAEMAGVSKTTASYALGQHKRGAIGTATRQRVIDVARKLGYRPNALARSLRRQARLT